MDNKIKGRYETKVRRKKRITLLILAGYLPNRNRMYVPHGASIVH